AGGDVGRRPGGGGHGGASVGAYVACEEFGASVQLDSPPAPACAQAGEGDRDWTIPLGDEAPYGPGRRVAQDRPVAAGQQRRRLATERYQLSIENGIHAGVFSLQQTPYDHAGDRTRVDPGREQLPARNTAPLKLG